MILIVDDQIEQHVVGGGKGGDDPGGKAIGVDRDANGGGASVQMGQVLAELGLQEGDLIMVADQAQAGWCGGAGLTPADKRGAHAFFERFQALGNGGGGDAEAACGQIKATTAVDGCERGEEGIGEH